MGVLDQQVPIDHVVLLGRKRLERHGMLDHHGTFGGHRHVHFRRRVGHRHVVRREPAIQPHHPPAEQIREPECRQETGDEPLQPGIRGSQVVGHLRSR